MRINNNMSAVITNNQLLRTEDSLTQAMERLSSGLRINHASDDPAGMAIAGKMQAQIDGLDQASRNASDGISVLQTADGALNEVTQMLQRIRELSVQAANGLNSDAELSAIQSEISSLKDEIDRVSQSTEFNTKTLLDGSLDTRVYSNETGLSRLQVSDSVSAGKYIIDITAKSQKAEVVSADDFQTVAAKIVAQNLSGTISINGATASIEKNMTEAQIYTELRNAAEKANCEVTEKDDAGKLTISTNDSGTSAELKLDFSSDDLAAAFGMNTTNEEYGVDMQVTLKGAADDSLFDSRATAQVKGNKLTITSTNGFEMTMVVDEVPVTNEFVLDVTDIGPMDLQIGANQGQTMRVIIPSVSTESLYIDTVDVTKMGGADKAIKALDEAINRISDVRAKIGAFENRLEYSVSSLDETGENMTSAISRIQDVDMAEEMTEYTQYNVLQQAATSALSQANELPQLALQLLQ